MPMASAPLSSLVTDVNVLSLMLEAALLGKHGASLLEITL